MGAPGMGCPDGCVGYELTTDLDFDTDDDGDIDSDDDYWNNGDGWDPIGERLDGFDATFEGNRRTISHLFIDRGNYSGLLGETGSASLIRRLGLVDVDVTGENYVGGWSQRARAIFAPATLPAASRVATRSAA